mgnify:CR=1 FL=1
MVCASTSKNGSIWFGLLKSIVPCWTTSAALEGDLAALDLPRGRDNSGQLVRACPQPLRSALDAMRATLLSIRGARRRHQAHHVKCSGNAVVAASGPTGMAAVNLQRR